MTAFIVKDNGGTFENPPVGMHNAICYRIIDLGTHKGEYKGQVTIKREVMIGWEIDELMKDNRRFSVAGFYTNSLNEKSKLRAMLESWRSKSFSEEELNGFDMQNIVGKPCMVNLTLNENGKIKVAGVSPLAKGLMPLQLTNATQIFHLDHFDQATFDTLPEKLKEKIKTSPEYQQIVTGGSHVAETANSSYEDLTDDIPF